MYSSRSYRLFIYNHTGRMALVESAESVSASLYQNSQSAQPYDHHQFLHSPVFRCKTSIQTKIADRSIADATELAQRLNISSDHKFDYSEDPLTHTAPLVAEKLKKYATHRCDLFYLGFAQHWQ